MKVSIKVKTIKTRVQLTASPLNFMRETHTYFVEECKRIFPWGQEIVGLLNRYSNLVVTEIDEGVMGRIVYWLEGCELRVPIPDTFEKFMVCLHEIGHGVNNYQSALLGKLRAEYLTEKWALKMAKEMGFGHYSEMERWVKIRVCGNMLECLRKELDSIFYLPDFPKPLLSYIRPVLGRRHSIVKWKDSGGELHCYHIDRILTLVWKENQ